MNRNPARVGIYVDGTNIARNGGYGMRFDVLRDFAVRDGTHVVRANVYLSFDEERAESDDSYRRGQWSYHDSLRDFGYKVVTRPVRRYDNDGETVVKSDTGFDMAVELLLQTERLDRILIATGDGDFARVVRALQERGQRIELVAFDNVSGELRREADTFVSGYLVPNLLPLREEPADRGAAWGERGSRVRGLCYSHTGRGYGFLRFLRGIVPGLWVTNTRDDRSPYASAFLHDSQLPEEVEVRRLPSRNLVFEFDLQESEDREGPSWLAQNVKVVSGLRGAAVS